MTEDLRRRERSLAALEEALSREEAALPEPGAGAAEAARQVATLEAWVRDREREFRARFPELAATLPPEVPAAAEAPNGLEGQWATTLDKREALIEERRRLLAARAGAPARVSEAYAALKARLLERERRISEIVATAFSGAQSASAAAAPDVTPAAEPERRSEMRVFLEVPINLRSEHRLLTASMSNLSVGGVFIRSEDVLPVGRAVELTFNLPERGGLTAHGVVVWQRPASVGGSPGFGVRFTDIAEPARKVLDDFVRRTGRAARLPEGQG
jgi:uncharacterized protein (TIGR02266 family)